MECTCLQMELNHLEAMFVLSIGFSCTACVLGSKVRLVTLEMAIIVLKSLAVKDGKSRLEDFHFAMIEVCKVTVVIFIDGVFYVNAFLP